MNRNDIQAQADASEADYRDWCQQQAQNRWVGLGLPLAALSETVRWDEGTFFPHPLNTAADLDGSQLFEMEGFGGGSDQERLDVLKRAIRGLPRTGRIQHRHQPGKNQPPAEDGT